MTRGNLGLGQELLIRKLLRNPVDCLLRNIVCFKALTLCVSMKLKLINHTRKYITFDTGSIYGCLVLAPHYKSFTIFLWVNVTVFKNGLAHTYVELWMDLTKQLGFPRSQSDVHFFPNKPVPVEWFCAWRACKGTDRFMVVAYEGWSGVASSKSSADCGKLKGLLGQRQAGVWPMAEICVWKQGPGDLEKRTDLPSGELLGKMHEREKERLSVLFKQLSVLFSLFHCCG